MATSSHKTLQSMFLDGLVLSDKSYCFPLLYFIIIIYVKDVFDTDGYLHFWSAVQARSWRSITKSGAGLIWPSLYNRCLWGPACQSRDHSTRRPSINLTRRSVATLGRRVYPETPSAKNRSCFKTIGSGEILSVIQSNLRKDRTTDLRESKCFL